MGTRTATYDRAAALADFEKTFRQLAPYKHRYEVFKDFVTMAACSLHNGIFQTMEATDWPEFVQEREAEYLRIIGAYKPDDQQVFGKLFAYLVTALDEEPRDVLGPLYMGLEIANKDAGQFFTPPELSELMARMTFAPELDKLENQDFLTAAEPACGAGGMILALVKVMTQAGYDPARKLWVQAIDVDRMAALMCYIQLSLWNVPAEIIVGNTLSLEFREIWYTPAHHLGRWKYRLSRKAENHEVEPRADNPTPPSQREAEDRDKTAPNLADAKPAAPVNPTQLGFDF